MNNKGKFWDWFAASLKSVADRAYHRGWHDGEYKAQHPEATGLPSEEMERGFYIGSGFEPEYVRGIYKDALQKTLPPDGI